MPTKVIKLYMVSLGAGASELVTIKALKALKSSDVICIPTKSKDGSFTKSITYSIVQELFKEFDFTKKIIAVYTPMKFKADDWQRQVDILSDATNNYNKVSFVTLGDAAIYSTVYYLLDIIKEQNINLYDSCEICEGITSFSHASAKLKKPLCVGDSSLNIIPLIDRELQNTTIYMRPVKGFDTSSIDEVGDIYTFENLNMQGETIIKGKKKLVDKYMTLFIDFFNPKLDK
jgi:precorrin-2/cobalt-factor-2 C20-methyltransferase